MISQSSILLSDPNIILETVMQLVYANKMIRVVGSAFNVSLKCNKGLKFLLKEMFSFIEGLSTQQVARTSVDFRLQPPGNY